ncbi:MAG TPA: hypothetical protein VEV43_01760 [Actinomycetota bacterium]|nr:hypothetical protein [Actinomycetota bacterium]
MKLYQPQQRIAKQVLLELTEWPRKLAPAERSYLDGVCAWPIERVDDGPKPVGVTMKRLPDRFFRHLSTGVSRPLELQYLLRPRSCVRLGIEVPSDEQRLTICTRYAEFLSFLHAHERIYGDVSATNWLWAAAPTPEIFVIDCDATRKRGGVPAVPVGGTPEWMDPTVPSSAQDVHSDRLLLSIAIIRILTGDPRRVYDPSLQQFGPPLTPEIVDLVRRAAVGSRGDRPPAGDYVQALTRALTSPGPASVRRRDTIQLHPKGASTGTTQAPRTRGSITLGGGRPKPAQPLAAGLWLPLMILLAWLASRAAA